MLPKTKDCEWLKPVKQVLCLSLRSSRQSGGTSIELYWLRTILTMFIHGIGSLFCFSCPNRNHDWPVSARLSLTEPNGRVMIYVLFRIGQQHILFGLDIRWFAKRDSYEN